MRYLQIFRLRKVLEILERDNELVVRKAEYD